MSGEVPAAAKIVPVEVVPADRYLRAASVAVKVNVAQSPPDMSAPVVVIYGDIIFRDSSGDRDMPAGRVVKYARRYLACD